MYVTLWLYMRLCVVNMCSELLKRLHATLAFSLEGAKRAPVLCLLAPKGQKAHFGSLHVGLPDQPFIDPLGCSGGWSQTAAGMLRLHLRAAHRLGQAGRALSSTASEEQGSSLACLGDTRAVLRLAGSNLLHFLQVRELGWPRC